MKIIKFKFQTALHFLTSYTDILNRASSITSVLEESGKALRKSGWENIIFSLFPLSTSCKTIACQQNHMCEVTEFRENCGSRALVFEKNGARKSEKFKNNTN